MSKDRRFNGIIFMLLAALGFSLMGGAVKGLKGQFSAGQLVFYRNAIGLLFIFPGILLKKPTQEGGRLTGLIFRGFVGTFALYSLLYCILHIPLGTAMSYSMTSTLFIAVFSFLLFREQHGGTVAMALLLGFTGMLLIYRPAIQFSWHYHLAGLLSGMSAAIAYMTVNRLSTYYDARIIVLSFLLSGVIIPLISMMLHYVFGMHPDGLFIIDFKWPNRWEWIWIFLMGAAALFGQYFVTKAYGADKAGIVSIFGYAGIIYAVFVGMLFGDKFPEWITWLGIFCIVLSGAAISWQKRKVIIPQENKK
jgi:drug/metabolite transporter (DMT)-like permease